MTIICHVSDKKLDILIPQKPEGAICFSENKFITYFGQYLYLFELERLKENFRIEKVPTTGLASMRTVSPELCDGIERIRYKSKSLGWEWRCYSSIPVDEFALGVLEHWNHMEGIVDEPAIPAKYLSIYIDETESALDSLTEMLLAHENDRDAATTESLLILSHRIKGSSASVGLNRAAKLSHYMEDLLQTQHNGDAYLTADMTDVLLRCTDALRTYITGLKSSAPESTGFNSLCIDLLGLLKDNVKTGDSHKTR